MVDELFDETKRDSAIGRIGGMLERYFDGDASKLAHLLDPTRLNSPMHQFRQEIAAGFKGLEERLIAIEAAAAARGAERARSAAKGADFEELLGTMLGEIARGAGDLIDRTGFETGSTIKSKRGDFVLTVDARVARGCDLKVVIEAKDRPMSMRAMRDELREARENRGAAVGVAVFSAAHAPTGIAPFTVVGGDVYCVIDPEAPETATLEAAIRLARLLGLASLVEREVDVDAAAIGTALTAIREQLEVVRQLKSQLTSISNATKAVWAGLDTMRSNILARVTEAESEIRASPTAAHLILPPSSHIGSGVVRTRRLSATLTSGCLWGVDKGTIIVLSPAHVTAICRLLRQPPEPEIPCVVPSPRCRFRCSSAWRWSSRRSPRTLHRARSVPRAERAALDRADTERRTDTEPEPEPSSEQTPSPEPAATTDPATPTPAEPAEPSSDPATAPESTPEATAAPAPDPGRRRAGHRREGPSDRHRSLHRPP